LFFIEEFIIEKKRIVFSVARKKFRETWCHSNISEDLPRV